MLNILRLALMKHLSTKETPEELQEAYQAFKNEESKATQALKQYGEMLFSHAVDRDGELMSFEASELVGIALTLKQITNLLQLAQYGREVTDLALDKIAYNGIIAKGGK